MNLHIKSLSVACLVAFPLSLLVSILTGCDSNESQSPKSVSSPEPWAAAFSGAVSGKTQMAEGNPEVRVSVVSTDPVLAEKIRAGVSAEVLFGGEVIRARFLGESSFKVEHVAVPIFRFGFVQDSSEPELEPGSSVDLRLTEIINSGSLPTFGE